MLLKKHIGYLVKHAKRNSNWEPYVDAFNLFSEGYNFLSFFENDPESKVKLIHKNIALRQKTIRVSN